MLKISNKLQDAIDKGILSTWYIRWQMVVMRWKKKQGFVRAEIDLALLEEFYSEALGINEKEVREKLEAENKKEVKDNEVIEQLSESLAKHRAARQTRYQLQQGSAELYESINTLLLWQKDRHS
jgi:Mn-dependent DtxR family transcriptional regulator